MQTLSTMVEMQKGGDEAYWAGQSHRFRYTTERIRALCPDGGRVLDIGSHYLHQAGLLRLLGYDVVGVDVPLFSRADFVVERAEQLGIQNLTISTLEDGQILSERSHDGTFDVVVFAAILEHITFNPVRLWRRIYELLSDRGKIYLTTPNSVRPASVLRHLKRLATFSGVGIPVDEVLGTITYGHHWKEYSGSEIKRYFELLSPDFSVSIRWHYDGPRNPGLKSALARVAGIFPPFRPEIEAVVSLSGKTQFTAQVPELPMASASRRRSHEDRR